MTRNAASSALYGAAILPRLALYVLVLLNLPAVAGQAQETAVTGTTVSLSVGGEVARPLRLTAAAISALPHQKLQVKEHDGREVTFEGVALSELLRLAGVASGEQLRGRNLSLYLVAEAKDGYRAVFALPELDPAFTDRVVLLADRRDGKALPDREGPWRIVVPDEKRQARWVRQVVSLTVRRAQ